MSAEVNENRFNIDGSLVVITGGNSGIGKETARKLSWKGASVLIACRNLDKANEAKIDIENETGNPVKVMKLDLSSLASVRDFSDMLIERYGVPDVLINNAAAYCRKHTKSPDGIEMTMAVNYFGVFSLTSLLLPFMLELPGESRIVNVSSDAYSVGPFYPDLGRAMKLSGFRAYAMSKRALMYYTFELADKLKISNVTVNCVNPGHSATGIWPSDTWYWKIAKSIISMSADPASYAAENVVYTAASPELSQVTGKYISDMKISKTNDKVLKDIEKEQLWDFSISFLEELGAI